MLNRLSHPGAPLTVFFDTGLNCRCPEVIKPWWESDIFFLSHFLLHELSITVIYPQIWRMGMRGFHWFDPCQKASFAQRHSQVYFVLMESSYLFQPCKSPNFPILFIHFDFCLLISKFFLSSALFVVHCQIQPVIPNTCYLHSIFSSLCHILEYSLDMFYTLQVIAG